ncbi:diphthamide biosynthesis enzyme Dph2 [[Eubacterium] cellulosolvens]
MYRLDEQKVINHIESLKAKRVILQLPEGLKPHGFELARKIENNAKVQVYISADPCYGACDLPQEAYQLLQADLIVHYGHTALTKYDRDNILFIEAFSDVKVKPALHKALKLLENDMKIGLATTVQHIPILKEAKQILERAGLNVSIGKASGKLKYDGQILGCDYSTAQQISDKVDAFIILAGGEFHAIGLQVSTGKRTIIADPYTGDARDVTGKYRIYQKKRMAAIGRFLESRRVAVILGLKTGQIELKKAENIKKRIERGGRECVVIYCREITPENLASFTDIELFVNTACPRVAHDDAGKFLKPIVNSEDIEPFLK